MAETHPWMAEVIDLKRQGLETADIAKAVDKHPATIRKAIAKAREAGELPIEGQTTVDDFVDPVVTNNTFGGSDVPPEDDPEYEPRDPLEDFRAEAGEAVGDMPPVSPPEPGETEHVLPVLQGTRQMALDFGPNAAPIVQSTVKFTSEKWPSGHFGAGDVVTGTFTARIVSVPHKEAFDKASEEFRAKPMVYGALITEIEYEAVTEDA